MDEEQTKETFLQKVTWKHALAASLLVFVVYPKPFFYLFRPLIKHFRANYQQASIPPRVEKIIFTVNRFITQKQLIKNKIISQNIELRIIDKYDQEIRESDEKTQPLLQLLAENVKQEIHLYQLQVDYKYTQNTVILVRGGEKLVRRVEGKLLGLKNDETYKIRQFDNRNDVHILERNQNLDSYEHKVKKLAFYE